MKKIAIIGLKGLPAFGGAARAGESVINMLKEKYDFYVYAMDSHTRYNGRYNGFTQIVFKSLKNKKLNTFVYYIKSMFHCLFAGRYDLVVVYHLDAGFIIPFLRLKYKVVGSARGLPQSTDKWSLTEKYMFDFFEYLFLKFSTKIVSVSEPHIERFRKKNKREYLYIPNGIYTNLETYPVKEKDYIFFSAARILGIKGCHIMLKALIKINYRGKIIIAGNLDHIASYKKEILKLSEKLDVEFLGLITDKKLLMTYLKNAKLFIFPSFTEGMSNMLLEAASMKVPIICSNIPENKVVFKNDEVTYFNTGDVNDLAIKVSYALGNMEKMKNNANKAFNRLENEFTWKIVASKYHDLYQSLLEN